MAETTFRIMPAESQVTFLAESSLHPIEVRATPQGWFAARLGDAGIIDGEGAAGHLEIPVSDLSSGNPLLDRETKRRTNAKDHPFIIGDLTTVLAVDDAEADIEGRIAFRGEEVDVEGRIELTSIEPERIVLEGEGLFDVRWWGLEPPRLLMLKVHPEVTVRIRLVMDAESDG